MRNELIELARSLAAAGGFGIADGCYNALDSMIDDAEKKIIVEPHRRLEMTLNFAHLLMSMMEKVDREHQPELHEPSLIMQKLNYVQFSLLRK